MEIVFVRNVGSLGYPGGSCSDCAGTAKLRDVEGVDRLYDEPLKQRQGDAPGKLIQVLAELVDNAQQE